MANITCAFTGTGALGNADTGEASEVLLGTWARDADVLKRTTLADTEMVVYNCGNTNHHVKATISNSNANCGVAFRVQDIDNYYVNFNNGSSSQLLKRVAGAYTSLGPAGTAAIGGQTLEGDAQGTRIRILVNGVQQAAVIDSSLTTGTKAGPRAGTNSQTWYDNLDIAYGVPTFVTAGTAVTSTGAATAVAWGADHAANDIGLLVVETSGNSASMAAPSGWTELTTAVVDVATTAGSKLQAFWKRATSAAEATVSTGALTDHMVAQVLVFRGAVTSGDPFEATTSGNTAAGTTSTLSSITTTGANELVVLITSRPNDLASTTAFSVPVNANLLNLAELTEAGTISGNGGGFQVASGTKVAAGATGTTSVTKATSTTSAFIVTALKPQSASSAVAKSGTDTGAGADGTATLRQSTTDTGFGTEGTNTRSITSSATDTGSGSDTATRSVAVGGTDTGAGAESASITVVLSSADTGAGFDNRVTGGSGGSLYWGSWMNGNPTYREIYPGGYVPSQLWYVWDSTVQSWNFGNTGTQSMAVSSTHKRDGANSLAVTRNMAATTDTMWIRSGSGEYTVLPSTTTTFGVWVYLPAGTAGTWTARGGIRTTSATDVFAGTWITLTAGKWEHITFNFGGAGYTAGQVERWMVQVERASGTAGNVTVYFDNHTIGTIPVAKTWDDAPWDSDTMNRFDADAGKAPSIIHYGQPPPWTQVFYPGVADYVTARGAIPMMGIQTIGTTLASQVAGGKDSDWTTFFTAIKNWGKPIFLRPNHEMNGTWYDYGVETNADPQVFIDWWRRIHGLAVAAGATNISWFWCPNRHNSGWISYSSFYPGDAYVDWVGFDGYNFGTVAGDIWRSVDNIVTESYNLCQAVAPDKPVMIGEIGCEEVGGDKAAWITDLLSKLAGGTYPNLKGLVWFNWRIPENGRSWDWPITSTFAARDAWRAGITDPAFLANNYGSLPTLAKVPVPASNPLAPASKVGADAGVGADVATLATALLKSGTDVGTALEIATLVVQAAGSESGFAVDLAALQAAISAVEAGTSSEGTPDIDMENPVPSVNELNGVDVALGIDHAWVKYHRLITRLSTRNFPWGYGGGPRPRRGV